MLFERPPTHNTPGCNARRDRDVREALRGIDVVEQPRGVLNCREELPVNGFFYQNRHRETLRRARQHQPQRDRPPLIEREARFLGILHEHEGSAFESAGRAFRRIKYARLAEYGFLVKSLRQDRIFDFYRAKYRTQSGPPATAPCTDCARGKISVKRVGNVAADSQGDDWGGLVANM